jgi:ABC-2 type transport system ATP-binding protein
MDAILTTSWLTKRYGSATALNEVNLQIPRGKIIGLLGPNGSGKTTFLKLMAGLLTPTYGKMEICGKPVGPETKALVSYLPDRTYLENRQKVRQQLDYFQDFYADFDRDRAEALLRDLGISLDSRFGELSKGTREKVQLILVMSRRAKLYLLDEPIGGVDPATRDYILNTIVSNFDPDATVVISTHLISDVENILDGYVFLHNGKIVRQGEVSQTREETGKTLDELFREVFRCLPNY